MTRLERAARHGLPHISAGHVGEQFDSSQSGTVQIVADSSGPKSFVLSILTDPPRADILDRAAAMEEFLDRQQVEVHSSGRPSNQETGAD